MCAERFITACMMSGKQREDVVKEYGVYIDEYQKKGPPEYAGLKKYLLTFNNTKYILITVIKDNFEMFEYTVKEEGLEDAIFYKSKEAFNRIHPERKEPSMLLVIFDLSKVK